MIDKEILDKTFKQITEENRNALATGFQDLDILLSGVEKGNLITIGARPAMGKTAFILSIMSNLLKQNKKCLLFSLEMSTSQIIKRLIAILGEIGLITMNHNKLLDDSQKSKIEYILTAISYLNLTICDDIYTIEGIRNKIAEERPEYVFIDYLQLMETPRKKQRSEAITNIMLDLKQIAKENNCIIFISSQLSRALESRCDKRPMLLLIYRDEYYKACVDDEDYALNKGKAEIIVAKNKMGATAIIELLFRSPIAKFLEPIQYDLF